MTGLCCPLVTSAEGLLVLNPQALLSWLEHTDGCAGCGQQMEISTAQIAVASLGFGDVFLKQSVGH